jgi:activator of 2-hydroxyglutaryl-CoA dehydratase/intein/homing endonuclease
MKTYLGIDVGSLTCKIVLIGEKGEIIYAEYFRTEGNPIGSIQKGLKELKNYIDSRNPEIEIAGVGTTGSARHLAGVITGADLIKNEITAHAKGTTYFIPDVRTIIEIGGQDSKVIILENGVAVDFAMNLLCLTKDTKIITENYLPKSINEVKIGEKVLTHKGRFKPVEQVFERKHQGEIIKIELSKLKTLKLTPEHPILALRREEIKCYQSYSRNNIPICKPSEERSCNKSCTKYKRFSWEPKFIPAKELRKGDFVTIPLSIENEMSDPVSIDYSMVKTEPKIFRPFKKISEFTFGPSLLRLLGYYLAEGCILYNKARGNKRIRYPCGVSFTFNINENKYIEDVKEIIYKNFKNLGITISKIPKHKACVISIYSKVLAEYLKYLCGSIAGQKKLSSELLNLEPYLQKEILKGFFKGDGQLRKRGRNALGIEKQGNRYCASTVSENLAHQLYWLLLRNKIKAKIRKSSKKTKGGKCAYFVEIFGKEVNKLEEGQLVNPTKQGYKSFIYFNWLFEPIKRIKKYNFKGKVYNLEVEEDNSYIANTLTVHNCAAGTGSFLDAQAFRLGIPIEKFGELSLKAENPTTVSSRCTIFAESDMIHKQQIGHKVEDIVAGLCQGLARNFLANVAKGKNIQPPIVFLGGVSENVGMRWAFENTLNQKIIVPKYNTVLGAFGVALLVKELVLEKTKFLGFEISDKDINCTSFQCKGCPNQCEVIEARIEGKVIARWGDRCGKWSNLNL